MNMNRLIAATCGELLTGTALAGAAVAQDATAKSGKLEDFNSCVETNASVLIPQGDLIQLCLTRHAAPMNRELINAQGSYCLLYTSPSPRDRQKSRMPSSA